MSQNIGGQLVKNYLFKATLFNNDYENVFYARYHSCIAMKYGDSIQFVSE